MIFYFENLSEIGFSEFLKTFLYGARLDASFIAYLCVIPFLLLLFSVWIPNKITSIILKIYTFIMLLISVILITSCDDDNNIEQEVNNSNSKSSNISC